MPTRPPTHKPPRAANTARHRAPEENRQARRALATNSTAWRSIRAAHLAREPLCRTCTAEGITQAATVVDHIDGNAMNDCPENRQSLCKPHHDRKTALENGSFGRWTMTPQWLLNCTKPLIVVCGPPGAGKTTYVARKAKPGDLVLDVDAIARDLGMDPWTMTNSQIGRAIAERNNRLSDFARGNTPHPRCWLIATAGSMKERTFWEGKGADLVMLNPGPSVCKQRIQRDQARPESVKRNQCAAVDRWR